VTEKDKKKCVKCQFCQKRSNEDFWTFQLLGFEMFQGRLQKKKKTHTSTEIHKGVIFDRFLVSRRSQLDD
jgi:hypothetical protein